MTLSLEEEDRKKLEHLAADDCRTLAGMIRWLIRSEVDRREGRAERAEAADIGAT